MANFCVKCGNKLVEGQACACQTVGNGLAYQQPTHEGSQSGAVGINGNISVNVNMQEATEYVKGMFATAKKILLAPYTKGAKMVESENVKQACSFIGLQAVMTALFVLILSIKAQSFMKMIFSVDASTADYFKIDQLIKFPLVKGLILTLLLSVGASCLLAGILFVVNKLFGNEVTYQKMLSVVSVRSVAIAAVTVPAMVILFVSAQYGLMVFLIAEILGNFYMLAACCGDQTMNSKNSTPVVVFISIIILAVVMGILVKNVFPQYLPDKMKLFVEEFINKLNKEGGLSGLYKSFLSDIL